MAVGGGGLYHHRRPGGHPGGVGGGMSIKQRAGMRALLWDVPAKGFPVALSHLRRGTGWDGNPRGARLET